MLDILTYPDPRLKCISEPVTDFGAELRAFADQLEATRLASPGCVGIAAPQVGHAIRLVIVDISTKPKHKNHGRLLLVNPEITQWEGLDLGREGCLSVPDYTGNVIRAERIVLRAWDLEGREQTYEMEGFEARAVQHEIDHLDGLLFLDRLVSHRSDLFKRKNYGSGKDAKG